MLVLSPDSTCDVCMDNYTDGAGMPHAIRCGHAFCRSCLTRMQPQCPLCRYNFNRSDIRKLHLGITSSATVAPQVDTQTQRLWEDIANAGRGNATLEEMQRVIDQCEVHLNAQLQGRLHTPLGVSRLLLSNLSEARRTLRVQAIELTKLKENRDHLMWDLVTALQREEAFQAPNDVRRYEVESTAWKTQSSREELDRLRSNNASAGVDRSRLPTTCRTAVASSFSGVETNRNRVESPAYRPDRPRSFLFDVVLASMGVVLFFRTLSAISGKR